LPIHPPDIDPSEASGLVTPRCQARSRPPRPALPAREGKRAMHSWETIVETAGRVPAGVWVLLATAAVLVTWRAARRRMRHAGRRTANPRLVAAGTSRAKDTALTVAAMIPAVLFWGMVLAGSFRGLVAFGRETLRWRDGWEYLVPGSLDGVSVTFAL